MAGDIDLDPLLHQPVRTRLAAYLAARGEATFTELKQILDVTDGNLDAHTRKLIAGGYLTVRRDESGARPQSIFALSARGRTAFERYVRALQGILGQGS